MNLRFLVSIAKSVFGVFGFSIQKSVPRYQMVRLVNRLRPESLPNGKARFGPHADGGYVLPAAWRPAFLFSPGVADEVGFELDLANRFGITCYLADASVESPPQSHPLFVFEKKFVGTASQSDFMTLDSWVHRSVGGRTGGLLQMDIEGYEYETIISSSSETLRQFDCIVIELHDFDMIATRSGLILMSHFLDSLREFKVVSIHANNAGRLSKFGSLPIPSTLELTFVRSAAFPASQLQSNWDDELGVTNVAGRGISLDQIWGEVESD